jgi:hypothetical protein
MPYILIGGAITPQCGNSVIKASESRYDLEEYAEKYVQDNPGTEVHIFSWASGYQSKISVTTERLWDSGYVEPPPPEEDPVPETLPTTDPSMESQAD